jgi:histidinol-phosphate aminotransferase
MTDRAASAPVPKSGILDIAPYVPGKASIEGVAHPIKLSANENVLGASEDARAAYIAAASDLQKYPDPRATALRWAIAAKYDLEPERLIFGAGSDEVFLLLAQTFLEPGDNIVQGLNAFASFAIAAKECQAQVKTAKEKPFRLDADAMLAEVDERTRLVFLANPSNPGGAWMTGGEVARLHAALPPNVVLVLDGAYSEFCDDPQFDDGLALARRASNVVVTRTFSKLHGLAALRIGWGYGPAELIAAMDRIRLPFNTGVAAQAAAVAALADDEFQQRSIEHVRRWRPWLIQQIGGLGVECPPTATNFVLLNFDGSRRTASEAEAFLASRGYLTRGLANYDLPNVLRITIGLEEHNRAVVELLAEFMGR